MNPLSILVTGSSNFTGTYIFRHLHAAVHKVTVPDGMPPKESLPDGVRFEPCDIRQGVFPKLCFDAVVQLAALAGVRPSMDRARHCPAPRTGPPPRAVSTPQLSSTASTGAASTHASTVSRCVPCASSPSGEPASAPILQWKPSKRAIEQERSVTVLRDGSQRRDLTHAADGVRAIELAIGF